MFENKDNLGQIFGDHLNVLSLSADYKAMKPARSVHFLCHHTVRLFINLKTERERESVCVCVKRGGEDEECVQERWVEVVTCVRACPSFSCGPLNVIVFDSVSGLGTSTHTPQLPNIS